MASGDAARQVFGEEVLRKYTSAAADDVTHHLSADDVLAATYSAAHYNRLTGKPSWTAVEHERMVSELKDEVQLGLDAGHDAEAAERAAAYEMLTGEAPWPDDQLERMRAALRNAPNGRNVYASVGTADQLADYVLLGGEPFWDEDEFHEMRTAVIADFKACVEAGDDVLAADRLAVFDVLEASFEARVAG